eukprot:6162980-Pyramimonas_sp.AAC.2
MQGTFDEHINIQGTFREDSGSIQGAFREHVNPPASGAGARRIAPAPPPKAPPPPGSTQTRAPAPPHTIMLRFQTYSEEKEIL